MIFDVQELTRKDFPKTVSFRIPVNDWLRKQFDIIEDFAQTSVNLSVLASSSSKKVFTYKPLWEGNEMFVSASPRCRYLKFNSSTGELETVDVSSMSEKGKCTVTLEVSHIYIGPHKNGEDYSLSLDIVQMIIYPIEEPQVILRKPPTKRRRRKENVVVSQTEAKA